MMTDRARIVTVDGARGVMAFAVMAYHVLNWAGIAETERIAYYAVYSFFVISGFALQTAYGERLADGSQVRAYLIKRFFRIAPLFYVALLLRLILLPWPGFDLVILNVTFTFGLAIPGATSLLTGGWSIGIEIAFYLLFPVATMWCGDSIRRRAWLAGLSILLMASFVNVVLRSHETMIAAWATYTQPLSFFGYFAAGMLIARVLQRAPQYKGHWTAFVVASAALLPFLLMHVDSNLLLLTGSNGLVLMTATIAFVGAVAFMPEPNGWIRTAAIWLGILSYPVYLLHPLVHQALLLTGQHGTWPHIAAVFVVTVVVSLGVHRWIEGPAREKGRRLASGPRLSGPASAGGPAANARASRR